MKSLIVRKIRPNAFITDIDCTVFMTQERNTFFLIRIVSLYADENGAKRKMKVLTAKLEGFILPRVC